MASCARVGSGSPSVCEISYLGIPQPGQLATPSHVHWTIELGLTTFRAHRRPALACQRIRGARGGEFEQTCRNRSRRPFRTLAASGKPCGVFRDRCSATVRSGTCRPNDGSVSDVPHDQAADEKRQAREECAKSYLDPQVSVTWVLRHKQCASRPCQNRCRQCY